MPFVIKKKSGLNVLRELRAEQCFPVINRGKLWYDTLTAQELEELKAWYRAWLDVTKTKVIPTKPLWLDKTIRQTEEILL